jgi:hypothetical protein
MQSSANQQARCNDHIIHPSPVGIEAPEDVACISLGVCVGEEFDVDGLKLLLADTPTGTLSQEGLVPIEDKINMGSNSSYVSNDTVLSHKVPTGTLSQEGLVPIEDKIKMRSNSSYVSNDTVLSHKVCLFRPEL